MTTPARKPSFWYYINLWDYNFCNNLKSKNTKIAEYSIILAKNKDKYFFILLNFKNTKYHNISEISFTEGFLENDWVFSYPASWAKIETITEKSKTAAFKPDNF